MALSKRLTIVSVLTAGLVVLIFAGLIQAKAATEIELKLINHLAIPAPEQDVFVEKAGFPVSQVWRVEAADVTDLAFLNKPVFAAATPIPHDPFKLGANPLGPFPKGRALGFTLGQFLAATGSGSYRADGNQASLDLALLNMIPNGLYTVWCSRVTFPPNFAVVDTPCGKPDGSENIVRADADGRLNYHLDLPALPESSAETATVIALAYHSDGKTYGANPGDFGLTSHVQTFALMPVPEAQAATGEVAQVAEAGGLNTNTVLALIGAILLLIIAWLVWRRKTV